MIPQMFVPSPGVEEIWKEKPMKPLDLTKPVRTQGGMTPIGGFEEDGVYYAWIAFNETALSPMRWYLPEGTAFSGCESHNLVNASEKHEGWVIMLRTPSGYMQPVGDFYDNELHGQCLQSASRDTRASTR
jgi:hypothetical protein